MVRVKHVFFPSLPWRYQAYGLTFLSDLLLPELSDIDLHKDVQADNLAEPDVVIERGTTLSKESVEEATATDAPLEKTLSFSPYRSHLLFGDVGRFTVTEGHHILIEPIEGCEVSSWRLPLLGAVLALLLEQRNLFVLHAGAVDMGGFAAAFLGDKGQGKSTLNAAMAMAGFPLLSDDAVALQWPDAERQTLPMALCGFAQVKLVPDAVRAVLQREPQELALVAPQLEDVDKRSFMAPLATQALPLRDLFVLTSLDDEAPLAPREHIISSAPVEVPEGVSLRLLSPQEALLHLIPHTFGFRFGDLYLQGERKITHFKECARIVSACRVWELARRRDLGLLPATVAMLARFAASVSENSSNLQS